MTTRTISRRPTAALAALMLLALLAMPTTARAEPVHLAPPFTDAWTQNWCDDITKLVEDCETSEDVDPETGAVALEASVRSPNEGSLPGPGTFHLSDGYLEVVHDLATGYDDVSLLISIDIASATTLVDTTPWLDLEESRASITARVRVSADHCGAPCDTSLSVPVLEQEGPGETSLSEHLLQIEVDATKRSRIPPGPLSVVVAFWTDVSFGTGQSGRAHVAIDATVSSVTATFN